MGVTGTNLAGLPWSGLKLFSVTAGTVGLLLVTTAGFAQTQIVFLDFDSGNDASIDYTQTMRSQIRDRLANKYAPWDIEFTTTNPGGTFSRLTFNEGFSGGDAQHIDFRNLDRSDTAVINVAGLGATTTAEVTEVSASIAAHELGHLLGLRHGDSFGPIGRGLGQPGPGNGAYRPSFPGPAGANEVSDDVMATTSFGSDNFFRNTWLSERSAIKTEFAFHGTVVHESPVPKWTLATAQPLELVNMTVPNTIVSGEQAGAGDFSVDAIALLGSLTVTQPVDYYRFQAVAGDLINVEVMSNALSHRMASTIDSQLALLDAFGNVVPYWGDTLDGAFNDDEFETFDSILLDVTLPTTGTYYLRVDTFSAGESGNYELFVHRFNHTVADFASCDFDTDGDCDLVDIDAMYPNFGGSNPKFDLNGDAQVDDEDLGQWLLDASAVDPLGRIFVRGDADLDGNVLGNDVTNVAANFGGTGTWSDGNFVISPGQGGALIEGNDFTILAAHFSFTSGVSAVPEPASLTWMMAACLLGMRYRELRN